MEGVELEEVKHDQGTELRKQKAGILLRSSGLRIWHCYCSGSGGYSGVGSTLAPGTSTCRGMAKKTRSQQEFLLWYSGLRNKYFQNNNNNKKESRRQIRVQINQSRMVGDRRGSEYRLESQAPGCSVELSGQMTNTQVFCLFVCLFLFFGGLFVCLLFRAAPTAYGDSQARGLNRSHSCQHRPQPKQRRIQATSSTYTTAHGNARSLTH